ncbi:MAG: hypothetical protein AB7G13_01960 [Lautropia sp.]
MDFGSPLSSNAWAVAIGWCYLATNSARLLTYVPQLLTVWRCRDGAQAISLLTWTSWVISHCTAVLYGVLVTSDFYLVLVSVINLLGCGAITAVAAARRRQHARHRRAGSRPLQPPMVLPPMIGSTMPVVNEASASDAR